MAFWRFDENFDEVNGGALYVDDDSADYKVAGALWIDDGGDGKEYFAFVAEFEDGYESEGFTVTDFSTAADAFNVASNGDVIEDLGTYDTIEEAVEAVETFIRG